MKKRMLCALLCLMMLFAVAAQAASEEAYRHVQQKLQQYGFLCDDVDYDRVVQLMEEDKQWMETMGGFMGSRYTSPQYFAYVYLMEEGLGRYDYNTFTWTPTSDKVYAFDAEVFNVEGMYTEILQGIDVIVPDITITDVQEDLSGITEEMDWETYSDGTRKVSFLCNGHPYEIELISYGDWVDVAFLDFLDEVLAKEGCPNQLYVLTHPLDQMILIYYGNEKDAREIAYMMDYMSYAEMEEEEPGGLLDFLNDFL